MKKVMTALTLILIASNLIFSNSSLASPFIGDGRARSNDKKNIYLYDVDFGLADSMKDIIQLGDYPVKSVSAYTINKFTQNDKKFAGRAPQISVLFIRYNQEVECIISSELLSSHGISMLEAVDKIKAGSLIVKCKVEDSRNKEFVATGFEYGK